MYSSHSPLFSGGALRTAAPLAFTPGPLSLRERGRKTSVRGTPPAPPVKGAPPLWTPWLVAALQPGRGEGAGGTPPETPVRGARPLWTPWLVAALQPGRGEGAGGKPPETPVKGAQPFENPVACEPASGDCRLSLAPVGRKRRKGHPLKPPSKERSAALVPVDTIGLLDYALWGAEGCPSGLW